MEKSTNPDLTGNGNDASSRKGGKSGIITRVKSMFTRPRKDAFSTQALKETMSTEELWNTIGFHRVAGSIFYQYVLLIGGAIIGLFTISIVAAFMPYPEISGYSGIVGSLTGFWFGLVELNLGNGGALSDSMNRLIGQYSDTNPQKAIEFIKFYIWWHFIVGVVQVTIFTMVALIYLVHTSLSYLTWFILAQSLVQYPGMLTIMQDSLKAFQRGDKASWLQWLQDTFFNVTINILFLIIGKYWGDSNPAIGELMGITIFYILSQFMGNYINLFIGARMFAGVMKDRGIQHGLIQLFIPHFDKPTVIQCLKFIGKQWVANQALGIIGYFIGIYVIISTPSFASWSGMLLIPNFLGHLVSMLNWGSPVVPAVSEAYNNGKPELARYFIHNMFKYWMFTTVFIATPLIILSSRVLNMIIVSGILGSNLANYQAGIVTIPVVMIIAASGQWRSWWGRLFVACNDPMPPIWLSYVFTAPGYILQFLFLYLCVTTYTLPVWLIPLGFSGFINSVIQTIFGWIWFQRRILKIGYKQMAWQALVVPMLSALCYAGCLLLFEWTIWPLMENVFAVLIGAKWGPVVWALFILLAVLFFFPLIFLCPFYALLGGWDSFTLEELRKTALITGPSKGIMLVMYKISLAFAKRSKLHDKFPLADYQVVEQQLRELIGEGKTNNLLRRK
ncbi:MAG TPA: hypothetical protein VKM55_21695 [Candidatus Lokiarchaeia archaeon]|nr:hypothetical protein [Candidatus Lokiarchaeia archaeon]